MLRKFEIKIQIGTKVRITGQDDWYYVKEIHPTRQWIQLDGLEGSFQRNHVTSYTNFFLRGA